VEVAAMRAKVAEKLAAKIGVVPDVVVGVPETGSYYAGPYSRGVEGGRTYLPSWPR
jgi:amidophosphoribosyltransferase (EC 2.4.2.14)